MFVFSVFYNSERINYFLNKKLNTLQNANDIFYLFFNFTVGVLAIQSGPVYYHTFYLNVLTYLLRIEYCWVDILLMLIDFGSDPIVPT